MTFIRVRNFEKFQHYRDRRPPWIKLYADLLDDVRFFEMSEQDRYVLIAMFILASQVGNKLPTNEKWLRQQLMINRPVPLKLLASLKWIEYIEDDVPALQNPWASRYISDETRFLVLERCEHKCVICESTDDLEIDHILPISQGGDSKEPNLQVLCRSCNRKKHNKTDSATDARQMLDRSSPIGEVKCPGETEGETEKSRDRGEGEGETRPYAFGEFENVLLTPDEHGKLIALLGTDGTNYWIEELSRAIASKGLKYKSHYATIKTWERMNEKREKRRETAAEARERERDEIDRRVRERFKNAGGLLSGNSN